jgi:hypothetical protein
MKCNAWTLALIGASLVSVPAVTRAEESTNAVPALLTGLSATTLSGYVDTSAHWNLGTGNANLPSYTPNGVAGGKKADGFNLDVVNLTLNHPPGEGDWGAGYNATLLFGPDAAGYNNSFGSATSDFSLKDTYVELKAPLGNGLDVKLGTYTEILGYEVYEAGNNPNYTRSYGYGFEPTQMTGALATYQISSVVTAMAGICDVWSAGVNARGSQPFASKAESFKTYMGGVTLTAPKEMGFLAGSTLMGGIINGFDALNNVDKTSWYIGGTFNTPVTALKLGFAVDYVNLADNHLGAVVDPVSGTRAAEGAGYQGAYGLYLNYQATEKLSLSTRGEYFSQSGYLAAFARESGIGMPSSGFEVTETAQYQLWKNVVSRVEFRWDHAEHGRSFGGTTDGSPALENAFLLAANLIYKF